LAEEEVMEAVDAATAPAGGKVNAVPIPEAPKNRLLAEGPVVKNAAGFSSWAGQEPLYILARLSVSELVTTKSELMAMADMPITGWSRPMTATGMAIKL